MPRSLINDILTSWNRSSQWTNECIKLTDSSLVKSLWMSCAIIVIIQNYQTGNICIIIFVEIYCVQTNKQWIKDEWKMSTIKFYCNWTSCWWLNGAMNRIDHRICGRESERSNEIVRLLVCLTEPEILFFRFCFGRCHYRYWWSLLPLTSAHLFDLLLSWMCSFNKFCWADVNEIFNLFYINWIGLISVFGAIQ